jgi:hypothetical protein
MLKFLRLFTLSSLLIAAAYTHASSEWTHRKTSDGISVYTKNVSGSPINAVKVIADINSPSKTLVALIQNMEKRTIWDSMCKAVKGVSTSKGKEGYHLVYEMPWPVTDRDMVMETETSQLGRTIVISNKALNDTRLNASKKFVRVTYATEEWTITPTSDNTSQLEGIIFLDPNGPIPAWLINMLSVSQPINVVRNLRDLTQ